MERNVRGIRPGASAVSLGGSGLRVAPTSVARAIPPAHEAARPHGIAAEPGTELVGSTGDGAVTLALGWRRDIQESVLREMA